MSTVEKNKKNLNPNDVFCSNCLANEGSSSAPKLSACSRCGLERYCSKDCQRAHWKANHKHYCVAKADRVPQLQETTSVVQRSASKTLDTNDKCAICLDPLADAPAKTLSCAHVFHGTCVSELQKIGVRQACPLCRSPLLTEPEKLVGEAARLYVVVQQLVNRGDATWSNLPASAQQDMDLAVSGFQHAAEQGSDMAQLILAGILVEGRGVSRNYVEAAKWYTKAADQGNADA